MQLVYRVVDANLNRIREALRVIEEYYRFIEENEVFAVSAKTIRHSIQDLADSIDQRSLILSRDSENDPFSTGVIANEMERNSLKSIVVANVKRAQEAARALEEYIKLLPEKAEAERAKKIRFAMYTFEKKILE